MMNVGSIANGTIKLARAPIPNVLPHQTLIKVSAFALNRGDLLQMEGLYPSPDGNPIPGLEVYGVDTATGEEVCALLQSGGYAEYAVADKKLVFPRPATYTEEESAALLESLATCYLNLFVTAHIKAGQVALIHGGTSSIGTMAISMCKLRGIEVVASASSARKLDQCRLFGADITVDYNTRYDEVLKDQVDVILDVLGGEHLERNLRCLKIGGHLASIAVMSGSTATIPLGRVLMKNLTITGRTLRSKAAEEKHWIINSALKDFGKEISTGTLKPTVDSVFKFSNLTEAITRLKNRLNFGKIVVTVDRGC